MLSRICVEFIEDEYDKYLKINNENYEFKYIPEFDKTLVFNTIEEAEKAIQKIINDNFPLPKGSFIIYKTIEIKTIPNEEKETRRKGKYYK